MKPRKPKAGNQAASFAPAYPIVIPGKVTFIVADGTSRELAWIETRSLPAVKVQAVVDKARRDNDDATAGTTYGYDVPGLVKLQEMQISVAAAIVSRLGEHPSTADDDNAHFALTQIRVVMPDPFRQGSGTKRSLWR